jgi:hypothetical protein
VSDCVIRVSSLAVRDALSVSLPAPPLAVARPGDPLLAAVIDVPQPGEHAAGDEDAGDLRECPVHVEPVQRLPSDYGVDGCVREGDG